MIHTHTHTHTHTHAHAHARTHARTHTHAHTHTRTHAIQVRVWDLATLSCERAVRQPACDYVGALLALEGEVWAGVGRALVVWGRRA